jgi:hypothetical protein
MSDPERPPEKFVHPFPPFGHTIQESVISCDPKDLQKPLSYPKKINNHSFWPRDPLKRRPQNIQPSKIDKLTLYTLLHYLEIECPNKKSINAL